MKESNAKIFAHVEVNGTTITVLKEKYVRKKQAQILLDKFLEHFESMGDEDMDFLIIQKGGRILHCHKVMGIEVNPPVCWRPLSEDDVDENGNLKPIQTFVSPENESLKSIAIKRFSKKISDDIGYLYFNQPHDSEPLDKQIENALNKTIRDDDCVSELKVTLPNGEEPDENGNLQVNVEMRLKNDIPQIVNYVSNE